MGDALRDAVEQRRQETDAQFQALCAALADRLRHARGKHEWPTIDTDPKAHFYALGALYGEAAELMEAVTDGQGRAREKDEALDVIVVAVRFWLGDHLPGGEK